MKTNIHLDSINAHFKEYTLELHDDDRIRIVMNGEYVTSMRCADGTLAYIKADNVEAI